MKTQEIQDSITAKIELLKSTINALIYEQAPENYAHEQRVAFHQRLEKIIAAKNGQIEGLIYARKLINKAL